HPLGDRQPAGRNRRPSGRPLPPGRQSARPPRPLTSRGSVASGRMSDVDLPSELQLALPLAAEADAVTGPAFEARRFTLDWKANRTEVTEIDRGVEAMIDGALARARPTRGRFGEEHGLAGDRTSPWRWIVDPIDGTSGFVR